MNNSKQAFPSPAPARKGLGVGILLPLLLLASFFFTGCLEDEEYTTSPNDFLISDIDTLRFDTIISGEPTNTYTFRLFNPAGKSLRIAQAYLESGTASPFHVNIDGAIIESGASVSLEVGKKDSVSVFLMANLPNVDQDLPQFVRDRLILVTEGGARTEIVLEASGQSVNKLHAERIAADTEFSSARPYQVFDSLVVAQGATLTLAAGTRLWMHPQARLVVRGTLRIEGTAEKPVVIRGDRLGDMFNSQPYDRIPEQWGGIVIAGESSGNQINHADIHSGAFGLLVEPGGDMTTERLRLENSVVHNMSGLCLETEGSKIHVGNCQITNGGNGCVYVRGGDVTFVHCTIGRFYVFTGGGDGAALTFTNADGAGNPLPLVRADFLNSIITGYSEDEVMAERAAEEETAAFNFRFDHCLLTTGAVDDPNIAYACLWDNDDAEVCRESNFTPDFDLKTLTFTFGLAAGSQAIGSADPTISSAYPTDLAGRPRGSAPDMGCYQHVPEE